MTIGPIGGVTPAGQSTTAAPAGPVRAPGIQDAAKLAEAFAKAVRRDGVPLAPQAPAMLPAKTAAKAAAGPGEEARPGDEALAGGLLLPPGPGAAHAAAAPPPATFVDPSAFADLLTGLWLREQGRTTREVRVRFGDAAWPATGARLVRAEDGSLHVALLLGDRGGVDGSGTEALAERLRARGLAVAAVSVEPDPC